MAINKLKSFRNNSKLAYLLVVGIWVFNTTISLNQNVDASTTRYNVSEFMLRVIQISLALPTLFIYLAITFAVVTFATYTSRIKGSKEADGYKYITNGLVLTLIYFVGQGLISLLQYKYKVGQEQINYIVLRNYFIVLMNIGIFWHFWKGSIKLVQTIGKENKSIENLSLAHFSLLIAGAVYTYFVFHNPNRTLSTNSLIPPTYGISDALILFVVIIPYLIAWFLASNAIVGLIHYAKNVQGVIFKNIFNDLARGFLYIVVLSISLQFLSQFSSSFANTSLGGILVLIAVIFFGLIVAYAQLGKAARKLDKIETI